MYQVTYLIDVEDELWEDTDQFDDFINLISHRIDKTRRKIDATHWAHWAGSHTILLLPDSNNCGKCANCGQWTSDKEKPDFISGLSIGATVNGVLLCDVCLPKNHPLAF